MFFETKGNDMEERDSQRGKLYKAEREALQKLAKPLPTVQDIERYLKRQSKRTTLSSRYGNAVDVIDWKLQVTDGRGTRHGYAHGSYKIGMPLFARNDWYTLHEWAHIIHSRISTAWFGPNGRRHLDVGSRTQELKGGAAHGWQYAAIYIDLVHFCMGKDAADALKASFKKHKVRFRPKQKRVVTPEQIERLRQARLSAKAA